MMRDDRSGWRRRESDPTDGLGIAIVGSAIMAVILIAVFYFWTAGQIG